MHQKHSAPIAHKVQRHFKSREPVYDCLVCEKQKNARQYQTTSGFLASLIEFLKRRRVFWSVWLLHKNAWIAKWAVSQNSRTMIDDGGKILHGKNAEFLLSHPLTTITGDLCTSMIASASFFKSNKLKCITFSEPRIRVHQGRSWLWYYRSSLRCRGHFVPTDGSITSHMLRTLRGNEAQESMQ